MLPPLGWWPNQSTSTSDQDQPAHTLDARLVGKYLLSPFPIRLCTENLDESLLSTVLRIYVVYPRDTTLPATRQRHESTVEDIGTSKVR